MASLLAVMPVCSTKVVGSVLLLSASAACGFGNLSNEVLDVAAFRRELQRVAAAVRTHREAPAPDACSGREAAHAEDLAFERLVASAVTLDACFVQMGHAEAAKIEETIELMDDEFEAHTAAACAVDDVENEYRRHEQRMDALIGAADSAAVRLGTMVSRGMSDGCVLAPP